MLRSKLRFVHAVLACTVAGTLSAQAAASRCVSPSTPGSGPLVATIPIDVDNNHVFVRVCVEGRPLQFILDTGAGSTLLDLETARSLGIPLGRRFEARGAGAGSVEGAQLVRPTSIAVAESIVVPSRAAIALDRIADHEGRAIHGILGYDFIERYVMAIDYRDRELRLYDPARFRYAGTGTSVPLTLRMNHPYVHGEVVLDDGARLPSDFVVDVGSSLALALSKPTVDRNQLRTRTGPTIRSASGRGVGGSSVAVIGRVAALRIGSTEVRRPVTHLFGDSAGVFSTTELGDGNIGGDVLRRFTVYFDYRGRRMILEPHEGTDEPFEADMSGATFRTTSGLTRIAVDRVLANSPAADAGLAVGDVLVAVDGQPANVSAIAALRRRLRREGERVVFVVQRDGIEREIRFTTRRLV